uniref:Uncharacterized protein n=1 Tax=Panagrolaimus superbus TaxID=310955 RepID=A0A914Z620_9BILA
METLSSTATFSEQDADCSDINEWYMKTAFARDDNGNMIVNKEDPLAPVKPTTDNMILETFESAPHGLTWKEFTDIYMEVHGAFFPENEREAVEARLESVPGIEVSEIDGCKVFDLIDVLTSSYSFECSSREPLPSYYSYDNSSIGVHTALEFEAALEEA